MVFINIRIIRAGRFMSRIAGAVSLMAGVSAAVAFPAGLGRGRGFPRRPREAGRRHPGVHADIRRQQPERRRAGFPPRRHPHRQCHSGGRFNPHQLCTNGTITLASPLPTIARKVTINATSAPTHVSGGPPVVALDFNGHPGLTIRRRLGRLAAAGSSRGRRQRQWRDAGRQFDHAQRQLHRSEPGRGRGRQRRQRRVRLGRVGRELHRR